MNVILIQPDEWLDAGCGEIEFSDRRFEYIRKVHRAAVGDELRVGVINDLLGTGRITKLDASSVRLAVTLNQAPPAPSPASLVLALPRPKVLKRILQTATALGVKSIHLINSYRVEKSFWQTPFLDPAIIHEQLLLGLEQCQDTRLPEVYQHQRFKPFVEDELPHLIHNKKAIVAHPRNTPTPFPAQLSDPCVLAIGPEGGFIPYEIELLESIGFSAKTLGPRILKVESAVSALLGRCL